MAHHAVALSRRGVEAPEEVIAFHGQGGDEAFGVSGSGGGGAETGGGGSFLQSAFSTVSCSLQGGVVPSQIGVVPPQTCRVFSTVSCSLQGGVVPP